MTTNQHTRGSGCLWRAVRRAWAALLHAHREQTLMWELRWQANRVTVPETDPLTWVVTLDGHRLAGRHLPAPADTGTGSTSPA